jgi:thiamine pyrophosphate-dependent acetolactate synthase large subunit-like protein
MGRDCHKVIHISYISAPIDPVYYPQQEVIGDITNSVSRLSELTTPQKKWDFSYFLNIKQKIESNIEEGAGKYGRWRFQMDFVNFGLDFNNPDFVNYAESYGANGYRMTASKHLATILTTCFAKLGVHVIEVTIDYSDNDKVKNYRSR